MKIRLAVADDEQTIVDITDAAYERWIPIIGRKPQPMGTDYAPLIAVGETWLIDVDGQPAGVIVLEDEGDHLLIYSIAVHPDFQKRGVGRRLLALAEERTLAKGYPLVRLYTNALMVENIALYMRVGYLETGRNSYKESARVNMEKRLSG